MNYKTFEVLKTEGESLVFVWGDSNIFHLKFTYSGSQINVDNSKLSARATVTIRE